MVTIAGEGRIVKGAEKADYGTSRGPVVGIVGLSFAAIQYLS
jgi:hypothetical protein